MGPFIMRLSAQDSLTFTRLVYSTWNFFLFLLLSITSGSPVGCDTHVAIPYYRKVMLHEIKVLEINVT